MTSCFTSGWVIYSQLERRLSALDSESRAHYSLVLCHGPVFLLLPVPALGLPSALDVGVSNTA